MRFDVWEGRQALRGAIANAIEQSSKPYHEALAPSARPTSLEQALQALASSAVVPEEVNMPAGEAELLAEAQRVCVVSTTASVDTASTPCYTARQHTKLMYEACIPRLPQLKHRLQLLSPNIKHVGLDDRFDQQFLDERLRAPRTSATAAQEFCMRGCPPAVRLSAWLDALQTDSAAQGHAASSDGADEETTMHLCSADEQEATFDSAVKACGQGSPCHGVASMMARRLAQSAQYFVFAEPAFAILSVLCRDGSFRFDEGEHDDDDLGILATATVEREQILPCKHLGMLLAPLLYLCNSHSAVLWLFKRLLKRQFWPLCTLSAVQEDGMLPLLRAADDFLHEQDPELAMHLRKLGLPPHAATGKWIISAFTTALPVREVLLLWDRIIGAQSNLLLPILAAAVLHFRRGKLLRCTEKRTAASCLNDISDCRVVPLIQAFLFAQQLR